MFQAKSFVVSFPRNKVTSDTDPGWESSRFALDTGSSPV